MPLVRPTTVCLILPDHVAAAANGWLLPELPAACRGLVFGCDPDMAELPESWRPMPRASDPLAALRAAQALDPTRDLLLISADALLPDGWWLRLMTAVATADGFDVISAIGSHHSALDPFAQPATEAVLAAG